MRYNLLKLMLLLLFMLLLLLLWLLMMLLLSFFMLKIFNNLEGGWEGQNKCVHIYMALIYLMRPWTMTHAENFQTSRVNYLSKNDPTQHIHVKSVYRTPKY